MARFRPALIIPAVLAALAWPPAPAALAQQRPEAMRRTVALFDFERQADNLAAVPQHWVRAQHDPPYRERPGFPSWNEATFDESIRAEGESSIRLPTRGGSAALRLVSGAVPVLPGSDYTVRGQVRTDGLTYARARITARLLDVFGAPLEDAEASTEPSRTAGAWMQVVATLPTAPDDAAWLQIELQLLQPRHLEEGGETEHEVHLDDVSGAAWFDDVGVYLTPKISLTATSNNGVFIAPARPSFTATVGDPTGEPLRASLELYDIDGTLQERVERDVTGGAWRTAWTPRVGSFGWRRATLRVFDSDRLLGEVSQNVVWLPSGAPPSEDERRHFGVMLEPPPEGTGERLLSLIGDLGVGAVDLPVWSERQAGGPTLSGSEFESTLDALLEQRVDVTLALEKAPKDVAARANARDDDILRLLASDGAAWRPALEGLLTRFGQRVQRWRLGRLNDGALPWREDVRSLIGQARAALRGLVLDPVATVGWPGGVAPPAWLAGEAAITLTAHLAFRPEGIPEALANLDDALDATVKLEGPAARHGARAQAAAISRRGAHAWRASPQRVAIDQPWRWTSDGGGGHRAQPSASFAAWRQVIDQLAGRRYLGDAPAPQGVTALAFEGDASDVIVAWNDRAQPEDALISAYLGEGPIRALDMFGNEIASWPTGEPVRLTLGDAPVYLVGVDARLARFLREFAIEPSFLPAVAARRPAEVRLVNPWDAPISGHLRIFSPESWAVEPRVLNFSLDPEETGLFPITLALGVGEEAGRQKVRAEVQLTAGSQRPVMTLEATVELGMPGVVLNAAAHVRRRGGETGDVVVSLLTTNTGEAPISLTAFVQAPGFSRQQAPISGLAPGASTLRRFTLPDAAARLAGGAALVGLIESDGLLRLNRRVTIPGEPSRPQPPEDATDPSG